jgi:hypothetical protein
MRTVAGGADPLGQFGSGEQPVRFGHAALVMQPFGFYRIQPMLLTGSPPTGQQDPGTPEDKGVRRTQGSLQRFAFRVREWRDEEWFGAHAHQNPVLQSKPTEKA